MSGELEEHIGQQRGPAVSTAEEDVDEFEWDADARPIPFREFVKEDVSAVGVLGGRVLFLCSRA